jgi:hypothetical protein
MNVRRAMLSVVVAVAAFVSVLGLQGHHDPLGQSGGTVTQAFRLMDDRGTHVEPGDDRGLRAEPGDDRGIRVEPGDDHGRGSEAGDDHGRRGRH